LFAQLAQELVLALLVFELAEMLAVQV